MLCHVSLCSCLHNTLSYWNHLQRSLCRMHNMYDNVYITLTPITYITMKY